MIRAPSIKSASIWEPTLETDFVYFHGCGIIIQQPAEMRIKAEAYVKLQHTAECHCESGLPSRRFALHI